MATSSQGIYCSFQGSTLTLTSLQVAENPDVVDSTDLGAAPNARRTYVNGFAVDREMTVDVITTTPIEVGASGELRIGGTGNLSPFNAVGTVQSSTVSGSVGDIMRGTVVFKVAEGSGFTGFG